MTENQPLAPVESKPNSYGAAQITVLEGLEAVRKAFGGEKLLNEVKKRGDAKKLVEKYHFKNHSILARALNEAKILKIFPNLEKSKAPLLSTFKVKRELNLFANTHDIKKLNVRTLKKVIQNWKSSLSNNPKLLVSAEQHNIIIGSLLGDGNMRMRDKNALFRVEHSDKQKDYLYWVYNTLKEFTLSEPKRSFRKDHKYATYSFTTFAHPAFNFYYNLFYKNGKKMVNEKILEQITPQSLAIWICDDGSFCNSIKDLIICTNSFSLEEHKLMQKYFLEKWGLNCSIRFRDEKYYYLSFYKKDTSKLANIIRGSIPLEQMKYKIGEKNG